MNPKVSYPKSLIKYAGGIRIKECGSFAAYIRAKPHCIYKTFKTNEEAEAFLKEFCIENSLVKNITYKYDNYWKVSLGKKRFMKFDEVDLPLVEKHLIHVCSGYAATYVNHKTTFFHNLILNHHDFSKYTVDHINRNPFDNRRSNLRLATPTMQAINTRIHAHNTTGIKGVSFSNGKYPMYIAEWFIDGKKHAKKFSTKKYGKQGAKDLAEMHRLWMEITIPVYRKCLVG